MQGGTSANGPLLVDDGEVLYGTVGGVFCNILASPAEVSAYAAGFLEPLDPSAEGSAYAAA